MTDRQRQSWLGGGRMLVASLFAVLVAGVLLPWGLGEAGVRWTATQSGLVAGATIVFAIVVLGSYSRRIGGLGRRRIRVASLTLVALVTATILLVALRARVDQIRAELRDATMTASADGRVLVIDGHVGDDFVEHLEEQLARLPELRRIDINSAGGLLDDTLVAAELVRARSLRVRVVDQCSSACVVLWAAAVPREMEVTAVIGVHRTWIDPTVPEAWESRVRGDYESRSLAILRGAGFSDVLLARRAATPPHAMAYLDAAELLDEGVQMLVVDREGNPLTPPRVKALIGDRRAEGPPRR